MILDSVEVVLGSGSGEAGMLPTALFELVLVSDLDLVRETE